MDDLVNFYTVTPRNKSCWKRQLNCSQKLIKSQASLSSRDGQCDSAWWTWGCCWRCCCQNSNKTKKVFLKNILAACSCAIIGDSQINCVHMIMRSGMLMMKETQMIANKGSARDRCDRGQKRGQTQQGVAHIDRQKRNFAQGSRPVRCDSLPRK